VVLLLLYLARKNLFFKPIKFTKQHRPQEFKKKGQKRVDSDFIAIEKKLVELGFTRNKWETYATWIKNIESHGHTVVVHTLLSETLCLHYRYRFDPKGLDSHDKIQLKTNIASLLHHYKSIPTNKTV